MSHALPPPDPVPPPPSPTLLPLNRGFATGSLEEDAYAPRYFASRGIEFAVAQSYSKVGRLASSEAVLLDPCPAVPGASTSSSAPLQTSLLPLIPTLRQNLGLYAERVGAMSFVLNGKAAAERTLSQMKRLARAM